MRKQSASELGRLASVQAEAMNDICHIYAVSFASGTYGTKITETRTLRVSGAACGLDYADGSVMRGNGLVFVDYDVMLRLPASQVISSGDEVELIEKGAFVVSGTFVLASPPTVSSSVQHVKLKRQTP
jgi:hypothetical protein